MVEDKELSPVDPKEGYNPDTDPNCIRCLDHGFVRFIESMGTDASIVQAARVSYGKGTKSVRADRALIHYLMQHRHTTPFEMVEFKFHCKMPVFVARQWIRHRTANVNEVSGRYSVMEETFWEPTAEDLRKQSSTNRQGSAEEHLTGEAAEKIAQEFQEEQKRLYGQYEKYMEAGVAREIARANLPFSLYTEWYWKIDLHNLLHFLSLRLDTHAQKEIRVYAEAMASFVKKECPLAWEAFEEHVLFGAHLSRQEKIAISTILKSRRLVEEVADLRKKELEKEGASPARIEREIESFRKKLGS